MNLAFVFLSFAILAVSDAIDTVNNKKFVSLQVLKTIGSIGNNQPAVFLSAPKLEVIQSSDSDGSENDDVILCDVLPIPLSSSLMNNLDIAYKYGKESSQVDKKQALIFSTSLVNRDGGIFDNLPYHWGKDTLSRRNIYSFLCGGEAEIYYDEGSSSSSSSSSGSGSSSNNNRIAFSKIARKEDSRLITPFCSVLQGVLNARIGGLLLEVSDVAERGAEQRLSVGAGVIITTMSSGDTFRLGKKNARIPTSIDEENCSGCVVKCTVDEVISLSLVTGKRVFIPKELFRAGATNAILSKSSDGKLTISCNDGVVSSGSSSSSGGGGVSSDNGSSNVITSNDWIDSNTDKVWEIYDPVRLINMGDVEKRAVLRCSGVSGLPRPREGVGRLNQLLLRLMDEAVRGEVLYIASNGSSSSSSSSGSNQWIDAALEIGYDPFNINIELSERQVLLRSMGQALERGQVEEASLLRSRFIELTRLKADPSQSEGEYSRWLDQDDWYEAERKRAMGN